MSTEKMIFIYNANSGALNSAFDIAHKIFKPSTYQCQLCTLTHGALSEHAAWKEFRKHTNVHIDFYHKDVYEKEIADASKHPTILSYPIILIKQADSECPTVFLSTDQINSYTTTEDLIQAITSTVQDESSKPDAEANI